MYLKSMMLNKKAILCVSVAVMISVFAVLADAAPVISVQAAGADEYGVLVGNSAASEESGSPASEEELEEHPLAGDEIMIGELIYRIQSLDQTTKTGIVSIIDQNGELSGTVEIPPEITLNGYTYDVRTIEAYAFAGCEGLKAITIPSSVNDIGDSAFMGCSALKCIYVDNMNTVYSSENGVLFDKTRTTLLQCPANYPERDYVVPNGVTALAASSFQNCLNLENLTVSATVNSVGEGAFGGCSGLNSVYYQGGTPSVGEGIYSDTPAELTSYYERKNEDNWQNAVINDDWQDRRAELIKTKLTVILPTVPAAVIYGDKVKLPAPKVEGLLPGDDVTIKTIAEGYNPGPASPAGSTYPVKASISGSDTRYYECDVIGGGIVMVMPRPLTITAPTPAEALVYGSPVPEMEAIIGEMVEGDEVTATVITTYTQGAQVGNYTTSIGEVTGVENYEVTTVDGTLMVTKADQVITLTVDPAMLYEGEYTQISATSTSGLDVKVTISDKNILSENGEALSGGTVTITATQPGNENYNAAEPVSRTVTVIKKEIITVTVKDESIIYGDEAPGYTYTMEPKTADVQVKLSCAYAQGDDVGTYPITATVTADARKYTVVTCNGTLTVEPLIELEVIWETPAPIDYGTPLSKDQLNATANVEGSFYYNPTFGTVLKSGVQKLSVIFKPANKRYGTQYLEVELVVNDVEQTSDKTINEVEQNDVSTPDASTDKHLAGIDEEPRIISYKVDRKAGTLTVKFTCDLYESEDSITWTLVESAKDTYTVSLKQGKRFYRAEK